MGRGAIATDPGTCNRKRRYASREEAEAAAARAPFKLRAYSCALCKRFHLTCRTKGMKIPRHELAQRAAGVRTIGETGETG
jgi:hypothetical protein